MSRRLLPALLATLVLAGCGSTGPAADVRVRQVSQPAPGLQLSATLDHSRLQAGALHLQLALKNTGSTPVDLQGAYCRITPVTLIQDSKGAFVWSQPIPMLECANPPADMVQSIRPGDQRTGTYCWQLTTGPTAGAGSCSPLTLPSGTYRVTGSFFDYPIPTLEFQIAR